MELLLLLLLLFRENWLTLTICFHPSHDSAECSVLCVLFLTWWFYSRRKVKTNNVQFLKKYINHFLSRTKKKKQTKCLGTEIRKPHSNSIFLFYPAKRIFTFSLHLHMRQERRRDKDSNRPCVCVCVWMCWYAAQEEAVNGCQVIGMVHQNWFRGG